MVQHVAKLTPTPVGVSLNGLKQWLEQVGLSARPIKPLGRQTWLVGFAEKTETRWWSWNGQVMMLNFLPEKGTISQRPIVASAAPKGDAKSARAVSKDGLSHDPWMEFRIKNGMSMPQRNTPESAAASSTSTKNVARVTEGPIKQRFLQQDMQIDALKKAVQGIQTSVDDAQKQQHDFQTAVDGRFKALQKDVSNQINLLGANSRTRSLLP